MKPLYELNVRELRKNYDYGELLFLEYLKDYISDDLKELYIDILAYNEIFANGWTINDLYNMGKNDKYWVDRANNFISKYNVPKEDYDEYCKYFDKYTELRDKLIDELGLSHYLDEDVPIDNISRQGIVEGEIITNIKNMSSDYSYTVARVMGYGYSVELHYNNGKATIEYGYKIKHDYWESKIEEVNWFNSNMNEKEILEKLSKLYDDCFGVDSKIEKEKNMDLEIVQEHLKELKKIRHDKEFYVALLIYELTDINEKTITQADVNKVYEIQKRSSSIFDPDLREQVEKEYEEREQEEIEK